jgi:hypothetical protein
MSLTVTASAEELAKLFHHYQEALAGDFECEPAKGREASWEKTPQNERELRIAAVRMALLELAETDDGLKRKYFATPGEAEWGC